MRFNRFDYWVYILQCSDASYYVGVTNNCEKRVIEHNAGINSDCYTFTRRPVRLVYAEHFDDILDAMEREKQIKKWTRRKKEALIHGRHETLPLQSKCRNPSNFRSRIQRERAYTKKQLKTFLSW